MHKVHRESLILLTRFYYLLLEYFFSIIVDGAFWQTYGGHRYSGAAPAKCAESHKKLSYFYNMAHLIRAHVQINAANTT